eukprot:3436697-Amphidinium_carterae.1
MSLRQAECRNHNAQHERLQSDAPHPRAHTHGFTCACVSITFQISLGGRQADFLSWSSFNTLWWCLALWTVMVYSTLSAIVADYQIKRGHTDTHTHTVFLEQQMALSMTCSVLYKMVWEDYGWGLRVQTYDV